MSDQPLSSPVGFSVPMAPASGISGAYSRTAQQQVFYIGFHQLLIIYVCQAVVLTPEEIAEQEQFRRNQIQNANNNSNNVVVATPMPRKLIALCTRVFLNHGFAFSGTSAVPSLQFVCYASSQQQQQRQRREQQ